MLVQILLLRSRKSKRDFSKLPRRRLAVSSTALASRLPITSRQSLIEPRRFKKSAKIRRREAKMTRKRRKRSLRNLNLNAWYCQKRK